MIQVYFDDSGTGNRSMVSMCGFAARDSMCESLARQWVDLLRKHGIDSLHTSAFLAGRGPYQELGLTAERRGEIALEFAVCLRRNAELFVAVAAENEALRSVGADLSPLQFCMFRTIRRTVDELRGWGEGTIPFAMNFDDSSEALECHKAVLDLRRHRTEVADSVGAYSFANDQHIQPLQAADLLACITTKEYRRGDAGWSDGPFREILFSEDQAFPQLTSVSELWTRESLTGAMYKGLTEERSPL
jgi:hypothetical protein